MNQNDITSPPSILIVDDNVNNLQVLGGFLKSEGMQIEFAINGISALNWLDKRLFDLILIDIMMPGMDGFDVCSRIKQNPATSEIPIIFITAKTDSESVIRGFELGAVDYITKPFIHSELLARVRTQLNIRKSQEQNQAYLKEIERRNRDINASIDYAKHIQDAVMSRSHNYLQYLQEHFSIYLPKDILSGDFFWVYKVESKIIIAVMDCTGHGVPGALMSILGIALLNETVLHDHIIQPNIILESLRSKIIMALAQRTGNDHVKDGIEGSVICFDTETKKLQYSGAFNPLIIMCNGEMTEIKADRFPIGYHDTYESFTLHELFIDRDETIYLFSDGIIDQFGGLKDKRFMLEHLKEIIYLNHNESMERQKELLLSELDDWKGDLDQTDDILILGIRF
jgi:DNA-binding response OmpR family regulator